MTAAIFLLAIVVGVAGPIGIKYLVAAGYPYSELIFWRSTFCLIMVAPFSLGAIRQPGALLSRISLIRMIIGGSILSLSAFSYSTLSATEVNMLSRLDLPIFLILFGSGSKRVMALGLVLLGALYSLVPIHHGQLSGISAIWAATLMTAISYWLIRKAAAKRCLAALVMPPYFGSILVSLLIIRHAPSPPPAAFLPALLLTSGCAVGLYILTAELFARTRLGMSELTGSIALLGTFAAETFILRGSPPQIAGIAASLSAVLGLVLVYFEEIQRWLKKKPQVQ